jgi:hypothetical protein
MLFAATHPVEGLSLETLEIFIITINGVNNNSNTILLFTPIEFNSFKF